MKRILIFGPCGAGKSTLAVKLGELLHLDVYHLDKIFWQPGWQEMDMAEFIPKVNNVAAKASWIIDGNYTKSLELRMQRADSILFLEFSRAFCTVRITKRILKSYGKVRPDLGEGCPEKFDIEVYKWLWGFYKGCGRKVKNCIEANQNGKSIYFLRNPSDVRLFLKGIKVKTG